MLLAALAALALVLRWTVFAPQPIPVRTAAAERGEVEASVSNSRAGTLRARRRAKLSPGTSGIVTAVDVRRGDSVQFGQRLLQLDERAQRAALAAAERELGVQAARSAASCLTAAHCEREWQRQAALAKQGLASADTLDQFSSALALARAECEVVAAEGERARAAIETVRVELDKTALCAPFDGIVAEVSVELGEWVTPSVALVAAPDVIELVDPRSIYVSAPMDEVDSAQLRAGLSARVTLDARPGQSFAGHVARVAPFVLDLERQNRTLEIEVEFEDADFARALLPGSSADAEVLLSVRSDVLRIPSGALLEGGRVLVAEDGVLVERRLELGLRNWDWTEVRGGLSEGERVVISLERAEVAAGARVLVRDSDGDGP